MIRYEHMEYICAGLNSFEREVVVIDCDDEHRGRKTLKLLKIANLEPHLGSWLPKKNEVAYLLFYQHTKEMVYQNPLHSQ